MSDILFDRSEGLATVTLNRPASRNAITAEMVLQFNDFLVSLESDRRIRCVLLTGAGAHFMAGGDVKSFGETLTMTAEERRVLFLRRIEAVSPLLLTMQRIPQILVTAVRGACAGAGLSWVAASDLSIASVKSFFVMAQVGIGVSPDGSGTWWLPRIVGLKRAKEIALLGGRFSAGDAERWGLVSRVVEDDQLEEETAKVVSTLAAGPAFALGRTKQLLNQAYQVALVDQLHAEAQSFADCAAHPDFAEGTRAFIEKRQPRFEGSS